ncbi:MAG: ComEC/Rec2 family competence protein [Patescibacteria group bacterium]
MLKLRKYGHWYFLGALALAVFVIWSAIFRIEAHRGLYMYVFDVGQGDAIFIEAPDGNQILIDGGPDSSILASLGKVLPFWDRVIDLVILTHPHADHLDGLLEVLKRYDVGMVLESGVNHTIPEYRQWRELIAGRKTPTVLAKRGQTIRLGSNISLAVLAPFRPVAGSSVKNIHDAAVVLRLEFASTTVLLMSDAEAALERELISSDLNISSDILKVGHHGSKTSTREGFLEAVEPHLAVISSGRRNRYGHPAEEVLDRLQSFGIRVLRTDQDGDIVLIIDGAGKRVQSSLEGSRSF